jgi:zinc protease
VTRRGDPDFFPLQVGNYILGGGGFVSRLTKEVREKRGYAYSVYSYFSPQRQPGPFQIGLQTQRAQAADALKVVDETLASFIANGPTTDELKAAKRNLVDGFSLRLDSNRKLLDSLATIGFYGLPLDWLSKFQERVEAVTAAQVKEAFQRRLSADHMVRVIVAGD